MSSPLDIVHNRTTTAAHDQMKARERADADKRRAHLDKQKSIVKSSPEDAKLYSRSLGGVGTHASVVLKIVHKDGSTVSFETCELIAQPDGSLKLIIACPSCIFRFDRPQADSQLTLTSNHRRFALDDVGRGNHWSNPQNPSELILMAGAIQTLDVQTCPVCHFRFHIDPSRDASDVRGVSVIREA